MQCELIVETLKGAESLQESMREMLGAGATAALSGFKGDRHRYQEDVVGWIGEAFDAIQVSLQQCSAEANSKVDNADAERSSLEAAVSTAQDSLAKLRDALADGELKSSNLEADASNAAIAVEDATSAEANAQERLADVATKKADLDALVSEGGQYSKWQSEAAAKKDATAFVRTLKSKRKFEHDLIQALTPTLVVEPSARTAFDKLVLQHFEQAVATAATEYSSVLQGAEAEKTQHAAATAEAQQARDAAKAAARADSIVAAAAAAAVEQSAVELKTAQQALREHGPAVQEAAAAAKDADASLEEFRSGPLAAFEELRDRSPPAEEPTIEAVVENAVPEEPTIEAVAENAAPESAQA